MKNESPKLSKAELAALDLLIESTREAGGTLAWPAAAARVVAKAAASAVVKEAVSRVANAVLGANAKIDALSENQTSELLESFKGVTEEEELTLEQLIELRNKLK